MDVSKIKVAKTYGHVYGDSIGTPSGRVVWVSLVSPKPGMKDPKTGVEGVAKYEVSLLLDKEGPHTDKFIKVLKSYVDKMVEAYNRGKKSKIAIDEVLRDGDDASMYDPEKGKYWAGNWVVRARHSEQPVICGTKRTNDGWEEIDPKLIQGGCLCRLVVSPMITSGGQLTFLLLYVQLVKDDGTRFGGGFDKKSYGSLLKNDEFGDEVEETTAEEAADAALGNGVDEEEEDDTEGPTPTPEFEDEDEEEEEDLAPRKRGRPPGRRGKSALIDKL